MEATSKISKIVYKIEDLLYSGKSLDEVKNMINELKKNGDFPQNLELVDTVASPTGVCGAAFKDINTGEVTVGFAGTNLGTSKIEGAKDIIADGAIGVTGLSTEGIYLKDANDFIKKLEKDGYNVTQVTGHSLGGAISVLVGVNNNIPLVVTYNGAPLYVLTHQIDSSVGLGISLLINKLQNDIKEKVDDYDGRVIRFVTSGDPLNNIADFANGYYIGEEVKFNNGKGHDMDFFLEDIEQAFIEEILRIEKGNWDTNTSVDFDGDNKADLILEPTQIIVKNLLSNNSESYSSSSKIKISPETLKVLGKNLATMAESDIAWIKNGVKFCIDKNETIKNKKPSRQDRLYDDIILDLKNSKLTQLLRDIDASHGKLSTGKNKQVLQELKDFKTYNVTRKFDSWGDSAGRKWYLNGESFDEEKLIKWVKDIKSKAESLFYELTSTGEYRTYDMGREVVYKYDTISVIGQAYVNVTNNFLMKTKEVFKGTGLRSGKNDGIVNALTEVLEVENKNIEEIKKKLYNLSIMAYGISSNFTEVDKGLSSYISYGKPISSITVSDITESYKVYLERNGILDDVKDVIEALDKQVEEASDKLAREIIKDYDSLILRTATKFKAICDKIGLFNKAINEISKIMDGVITSTKCRQEINTDYIPGLDECYITVTKTYEHGSLRSILPEDFSENIIYAKKNISNLLESFYGAMNVAEVYKSNIYNFRFYFKNIIERAVYNSMELDEIIQSQKMIASILERMKTEVSNVALQIHSEFYGDAFKAYETELNNTVKLFSYLGIMLEECFGTKIQGTLNPTNSRS